MMVGPIHDRERRRGRIRRGGGAAGTKGVRDEGPASRTESHINGREARRNREHERMNRIQMGGVRR